MSTWLQTFSATDLGAVRAGEGTTAGRQICFRTEIASTIWLTGEALAAIVTGSAGNWQ